MAQVKQLAKPDTVKQAKPKPAKPGARVKPGSQPVSAPGALPDKPGLNERLLAQVIRVLELRQRKATSSTKTRGEVRGGGRKPWRQKGTGRARVGSIRSPIWRGGGIVFGPQTERHYKLAIPRSMKTRALDQLIKLKKTEGSLKIIEQWPFKQGKTKEAIGLLKELGKEGTFLFLSEKFGDAMKRATRNLPNVRLETIHNVNARDILLMDMVVIDKAAHEKLKERLTP